MTTQEAYENSFEGTWLVSEYVYSPSGEFAGVVRQTRQVEALEEGRVRVTQQCTPGPELDEGPMASFRGEHVFDLLPDGHARRYLGPAVVGSGLTWGDGAMTGRGLWPDFGHNFTSFAVMGEPDVQLTGGKFFTGTEMVANIVGIAEPQTSAEPVWPEFGGSKTPSDLSSTWRGQFRQVAPDGTVLAEESLERSYRCHGEQRTLTEVADGVELLELQTDSAPTGRIQVSGVIGDVSVQGLGKAYGWLTEMEICLKPNRILEWMEVLDAQRRRLVGIRRWWKDAALERIDVINLSAYEP